MTDNLILYKRYLNTITEKLNAYFENQKEYIRCKKGCSHCCEKGVYPYSKVEAEFLIMGLLQLEQETRQAVIDRIKILKEECRNVRDFKHFMYRCPFLDENGVCTVYEYRGIICRTFGLLKFDDNNKIVLPFCSKLGLNYSEVYDEKTKSIIEKEGALNKPMAYKVKLETMKDVSEFNDAPDFGETKSLIEWL